MAPFNEEVGCWIRSVMGNVKDSVRIVINTVFLVFGHPRSIRKVDVFDL